MIRKGDPRIQVEGRTSNQILNDIRNDRDWYMWKYDLTPDDLWILLDWDIQIMIVKSCRQEDNEGPDRITRSTILGMHAINDRMKYVYVIPRHHIEREENQNFRSRNKSKNTSKNF